MLVGVHCGVRARSSRCWRSRSGARRVRRRQQRPTSRLDRPERRAPPCGRRRRRGLVACCCSACLWRACSPIARSRVCRSTTRSTSTLTGAPVLVGGPLRRPAPSRVLRDRERAARSGRPAGAAQAAGRRRDPQLLGAESARQEGPDPGPRIHRSPFAPIAPASIAASAPSSAATSMRTWRCSSSRTRPPTTSAGLAAQRRPAADAGRLREAQRGRELFEHASCAMCHAIAGTRGARHARAPDLTHVASRAHARRRHAAEHRRRRAPRWIADPQRSSPASTCRRIALRRRISLRSRRISDRCNDGSRDASRDAGAATGERDRDRGARRQLRDGAAPDRPPPRARAHVDRQAGRDRLPDGNDHKAIGRRFIVTALRASSSRPACWRR